MKSTSNEQLPSTKYKSQLPDKLFAANVLPYTPQKSWPGRHYGRIGPEHILKVLHESKFI